MARLLRSGERRGSATLFRLLPQGGEQRLEAPAHESPVAYDATSELARVSFVLDFDEETVLVGYPKAKLWVEAGDADDMDLFVLGPVYKVRGRSHSAMAATWRVAS